MQQHSICASIKGAVCNFHPCKLSAGAPFQLAPFNMAALACLCVDEPASSRLVLIQLGFEIIRSESRQARQMKATHNANNCPETIGPCRANCQPYIGLSASFAIANKAICGTRNHFHTPCALSPTRTLLQIMTLIWQRDCSY